MTDPNVRRLIRDQWVRLHGTPRVTVLAGGERAKQLWLRWVELNGAPSTLLEGDLDHDLTAALTRAVEEPAHPVAVLVSPDKLDAWRAHRTDRLAAVVDEGLLRVVDTSPDDAETRSAPGSPRRVAPDAFDARSLAEATLFEALEATPATTGRFELNASLSVRFGSNAAEIDLLSRADDVAIEIDGYHHFQDLDAYRRDRRKDLLLQTQGLLVIRLLAEDVMRDVREAVQVVCQGLAYRRGARQP